MRSSKTTDETRVGTTGEILNDIILEPMLRSFLGRNYVGRTLT